VQEGFVDGKLARRLLADLARVTPRARAVTRSPTVPRAKASGEVAYGRNRKDEGERRPDPEPAAKSRKGQPNEAWSAGAEATFKKTGWRAAV